MSVKKVFVALRDGYVVAQARRARLPEFTCERVERVRVRFSGRVQKVGFRLEVCELAKRLELTGWCRNLENGDVLAELQGPEDKIRFLTGFMGSLKRIRIREQVVEKLELDPAEREFVQR